MPIPARRHLPTAEPDLEIQITDDGSRTLVRTDRSDAYHSGCGAIAESRHVYLQNSGVRDRLADGRATRVLELGFGTGMNALMTIDLAVRYHASLRYVALDLRLPDAETLAGLLPQTWVDDPRLADSFLAWRSASDSSIPESLCWSPADNVVLEIRLADFHAFRPDDDAGFDAIYFDPFAPATDPASWSVEIFARMRQSLAPEGRLVTYCVSRRVRDACRDAGLDVRRVAGPSGGKREVMIATATVTSS